MVVVSSRLAKKEFETFIKESGRVENEDETTKTYTIVGDAISRFRKLEKSLVTSSQATHLVPRSFLVSLVSQYDSYIGH